MFDLYILGLLLSIIGVFLLGYFGLPTTYLEKHVVSWGFDRKEQKIRQLYSWVGIIVTLIGFILQIKFR